MKLFQRACYLLIALDLLLAIAHVLWPEYQWGQGRKSYFNFDNSLTFASWFAAMQMAGISLLALFSFHRERRVANRSIHQSAWVWLSISLIMLVLSIAEITRFPIKLKWVDSPISDIYSQFVILPLALAFFVLVAWFLLHRFQLTGAKSQRHSFSVLFWVCAWGVMLLAPLISSSPFFLSLVSATSVDTALVKGLAYLLGSTALLYAVGHYALAPHLGEITTQNKKSDVFPEGAMRYWIYFGVGATTFSIIFLQIILFRLINIFGDYLTANSVISIALLGLSAGGLIGFIAAYKAPVKTMIAASLLFPFFILLSFGSVVSLMDAKLLTSLLLTLPFISASTVITIALVRIKSHFIYFIDLVGAGLGALLVSYAFSHFREESSLLFLSAFAFLIALSFIVLHSQRWVKSVLVIIALIGAGSFYYAGRTNLQTDTLNIIQNKVEKRYPQAEVLYSKSSLVGRYDAVRRSPGNSSVAGFENGRVTDNMRNRPTAYYEIDPRLPSKIIKNPKILILGLSGDAITKTSKFLSDDVTGIEINPAVVSLQRNELVQFNAGSYQDIDVHVKNGRSFVNESDQQYDMITLMNAHAARGRTTGRAPSPEYLNTVEAMESFLDHLTDRGMVIIEEPVSSPRREIPIWKLVSTMRQALINQGNVSPDKHFFIFQWRTKRNNYIQILMKKTAFTSEDIVSLKLWLDDVDNRKKIEKREGRRMGPISTKTTLLHVPDDGYSTNYSRILRGETSDGFLEAYNLTATTDDRPFHFDVNPAHPEIKASYIRTLMMMMLLVPFFVFFLRQHRPELRYALPYTLVVSLTGLGYFFVEIVLMQYFAIFLGSPVAAFSTILGTLLIFSGVGSLWSGRIGEKGLYISFIAIFVLLLLHQLFGQDLFYLGAGLSLTGRVLVSIAAVAPLAFFMGVPLPYVMRKGNKHISKSTAAMLFAINAAASALAIPLAINISTSYGFNAALQTGSALYLIVGLLFVVMYRQRLQMLVTVLTLVLVGGLFISPWLVSKTATAKSTQTNLYDVYAVSYNRSKYKERKLIKGGSSKKYLPMEWMYWVIQGQGKNILVDTGSSASNKRMKRQARRLKQLNITPEEVNDIILTHAHWDHIGGLGMYKNATVWMQEKEYQHLKSSVSADKQKKKGMRWKDLKVLRQIEKEGRLQLINGEKELMPGITLTPDSSHTQGHQYVTVESIIGPVVIGGDVSYLYKNNRRHKPVGTAFDHEANLQTIKDIHRKAASPFYFIPGHDPLVMKWFPKVSKQIVKITAIK